MAVGGVAFAAVESVAVVVVVDFAGPWWSSVAIGDAEMQFAAAVVAAAVKTPPTAFEQRS